MQNRFAAVLSEGMEVRDINGDKVGKIGQIYRPVGAVAPSTAIPSGSTEPASLSDQYLKVDTGFLGIGEDLYIPTSAVSDVIGNHVVLNVDKDQVDTRGWDRPPGWVPDE